MRKPEMNYVAFLQATSSIRRAGSSAAALTGKPPSRLGSLASSPKHRRTGTQTEPPVAGTLPRPDSQRSLASTGEAAGPSRAPTADQQKPSQAEGSEPAIKLNLGAPAESMFSVKVSRPIVIIKALIAACTSECLSHSPAHAW